MIVIVVCTLLFWSANAVRVSPKLDFGDSNERSGIRPETGYAGSSYYQRPQTTPAVIDSIGIICTSNNCNTTKTTSENDNGVSTDVLVHVQTNVDLGKIKNETPQAVPDVPIVVGTKSSTTPTIPNTLNPIFPGSSYPSVNLLPPSSINDGLQPPRPYIPNSYLQSDSQVLGIPSFSTYAPQFQDNNNVVDFQTMYFGPPITRRYNYRPISPPTVWQPRGVRANVYNPVEFRKTYSNNWSPVLTRSNPTATRIGGVVPRWTPCVCQNPELHKYPTTPGYSVSSDPPGVSGKLASLA